VGKEPVVDTSPITTRSGVGGAVRIVKWISCGALAESGVKKKEKGATQEEDTEIEGSNREGGSCGTELSHSNVY